MATNAILNCGLTPLFRNREPWAVGRGPGAVGRERDDSLYIDTSSDVGLYTLSFTVIFATDTGGLLPWPRWGLETPKTPPRSAAAYSSTNNSSSSSNNSSSSSSSSSSSLKVSYSKKLHRYMAPPQITLSRFRSNPIQFISLSLQTLHPTPHPSMEETCG